MRNSVNQLAVDEAFETISTTPAMRWLERAEVREGMRVVIRRIASALFCIDGIDPTLISFAKYRAALHWNLTEEAVDVMVAARLLEKTVALMADLQRLELTTDAAPELPLAA
jgi:hypothetical protein